MAFRRVLSQPKGLAGLASAFSDHMVNSRSHFTQAYLEEREGLFKYTRGRWLYNEREQNDIRYTPFNHEELARVACEAMNARTCTLIEKFEEGSYNKAFRLTLDDSIRVVARLPCPLAGPSYLVTASEVATLQFAREVLHIPVPRVLTWSGSERNSVNRVGADYIIMEEVPGVRLGLRWTKFLHSDEVKPILTSLLDVEAKFQRLRFSCIGSLYFKKDVSEELKSLPLFSENSDTDLAQFSESYRIGPLIDRQFLIFFPSVPGPNATAYFIAAAKNEQKVLDRIDLTSTRYRRHPLHDRTVHSKLLAMYLAAIPYIMPPNDSDICAPTLWHPDLSLGNLFVSETGPAVLQGIIDWQHTSILPYFSFLSMPSAFIYEGDKIDMSGILPGPLPSDLDDRTPEEQAEYRLHLRLANRHKWYQGKSATARQVAPPCKPIGNAPHVRPPCLVGRCSRLTTCTSRRMRTMG